jgi:hypothetical protein
MPRADGCPQAVTGIPQFITVRGGAYFFLPSIRALRYFSGAGSPPAGLNGGTHK